MLETQQAFRIERAKFAMASPWTFTIPVIAEFVKEEMTPGKWIDPYAGQNSPAHLQNDINPGHPRTITWTR